MLTLIGTVQSDGISAEKFVHLCPMLIVQADSHVCVDGRHHDHDHHGHHKHDLEPPNWHSAAGTYFVVVN